MEWLIGIVIGLVLGVVVAALLLATAPARRRRLGPLQDL